ncbi:caspase family protein [Nostoc sp. JL23]|uniref:nSTAND1 domain-containing NTPase n=1 Tax=Nostoc sp. JL23 TaxID=2815394 RepID=UPI001D2AD437|nr:caspase family protein [Nostoc sp. JL23]MBN3878082.1 caspase family protein [Nostoc sp. JL23]
MSQYNFHRNFAVIIGINNYPNSIGELKTAVPDAVKLAEIIKNQHVTLQAQYQAQNKYEVELLLNQSASFSQLKQLIQDFKVGQIPLNNEKVTVTKNHRLLFYFAGHGIAKDALETQEGPVGYLIPQDASNDSSTWISMQELHDALNALPCRHMLAILDCCFAGAFRWASLKRQFGSTVKVYKERYDRFISDAAWQLITSAADDQKALDYLGSRGIVKDGNEDHSPFAKALFDALAGGGADLNKDGIITATELYSYLRDRMEIDSENLYQRQTPSLCPLRKHDKGEFIFLLPNFNRDNLEDAPPLNPENNPYKGLQSYNEKDSDLFFGREEQIEKLYQKVVDNKQRLTLVLGASGTGKSSLVKAGLISKLRKDDKTWCIFPTFRPGKSPFKSLKKALTLFKISSDLLTLSEESLANWFNNNPQAKLMVVIDQFEELITLCKREKREQFEKLIKNSLVTYSDRIHVVITLRLDFEAQFQTSVLKDFWNDDTRFVLPPMTQDDLRQVIEKPASQKVLYFDPPSLVDELINEVVQMPGALPLLSFTLSELYLKHLGDRTRDNRALTKTDYEQLGRVAGSLTKRANQQYDQLVEEDIAYKDTVHRVMLRMIALEGASLARRQVPKSELVYPNEEENKRVQTVIKQFSEARLIVEGFNSEDEAYVEPAHDYLVLGWDKLLLWKSQDQEILYLQRRLTSAAKDWSESKGSLWTEEEGRLSRLKLVIKSGRNWLNKIETEFINKSIKGRRKRFEENEKQRDEALQGQVSALAALSEARFQDDQLGALIHILKAARILQQLRNSESQWIQKDIYLRTQVVLRQILSKVKEFNRLQDNDKPFNSMRTLAFTTSNKLVLIEQGRLITLNSIFRQELILMENILPVKDDNSQNVTKRPVISFWQLNGGLENRGLVESPLDTWNTVSRMLAHFIHRTSQPQQEPKANAIRLINLEGKEVILQNDERDILMTFAFSPNGQLIASGGWFGELYLWKTDGTTIQQKQTGGNSLNTIDFSPNGNMFATGSNDGKIRFWDQNGEFLTEIEAHRDAIWGVSFSPDGETLASVSTDTTVKIWKTNDATLLTTLNGHRDKVGAVCFNSDGQILASASNDGSVRLWRPNGTKLKGLDDHHTGSVYAVRFNPKQPMIATTSGQGQLILWSQDGRLLRNWEKGHNGTITALDFSPNGRMFVTAAGDREVKLWKLDDDKDKQDFHAHNLGNHTGESHLPTVFGVSFSSDNQSILLGSGSQDGKGYLELCDSESKLCRIIAEYDYQVLAVCFSPDGQMFALGKGDGSVELWRKEEDNFKLLRNFKQHDNLVLVVCFSPDGNFLATGSADQTVKLWQIDNILNNTNSITVTPTKFAHTDQVTAVRFSPNGDMIATASNDKTVKLWNLDGNLKKTLHGHNDQINSLDFSTDGQILASASNDKIAILWNLELELGLDQLIDYGCEWISGYLTNNPNVSEDNRQVISPENFPNLKYDSQKWI